MLSCFVPLTLLFWGVFRVFLAKMKGTAVGTLNKYGNICTESTSFQSNDTDNEGNACDVLFGHLERWIISVIRYHL